MQCLSVEYKSVGTLKYKEIKKINFHSNLNFFEKSHITEIATCKIELLDVKKMLTLAGFEPKWFN